MSSSQVRRGKSLAPRLEELASQLSLPEQRLSAVAEIAMLSSCSETARRGMIVGSIERRLVEVLGNATGDQEQCWIMSTLSNLAGEKAGNVPSVRERQSDAVPMLCELMSSPSPHVKNGAALHLVTLSHSENMALAIGKSSALAQLHQLEQSPSPGEFRNPMQDEAAQYARWALRTAQGRNYKAAYAPKSRFELQKEALEARAQEAASIQLQSRVRGHATKRQFRQEREEKRGAATKVQSIYRGSGPRRARDKTRQRESNSAVVLQSRYRGHASRRTRARTAGQPASVSTPYLSLGMDVSAEGYVTLDILPPDGGDTTGDEFSVVLAVDDRGMVQVHLLFFEEATDEVQVLLEVDEDGTVLVDFAINEDEEPYKTEIIAQTLSEYMLSDKQPAAPASDKTAVIAQTLSDYMLSDAEVAYADLTLTLDDDGMVRIGVEVRDVRDSVPFVDSYVDLELTVEDGIVRVGLDVRDSEKVQPDEYPVRVAFDVDESGEARLRIQVQ